MILISLLCETNCHAEPRTNIVLQEASSFTQPKNIRGFVDLFRIDFEFAVEAIKKA